MYKVTKILYTHSFASSLPSLAHSSKTFILYLCHSQSRKASPFPPPTELAVSPKPCQLSGLAPLSPANMSFSHVAMPSDLVVPLISPSLGEFSSHSEGERILLINFQSKPYIIINCSNTTQIYQFLSSGGRAFKVFMVATQLQSAVGNFSYVNFIAFRQSAL